MQNPEDISNPKTAIDMAHVLMAKAFKLNETILIYNNQTSSSNPCNRQIAQPGNQIRYNAGQIIGNQVGQNMVQNPGIQNVENKNGLSVVPEIANQNGNENVVAVRVEGNSNGNNENQIRKINCSYLQEERKKLKDDFKTREDELLDKLIQYAKKIKELDNILIKTGQSVKTMHMLSPKSDSFYHTEQKKALGYQNSFYLKQAQQKQQSLYNGIVLLEKHDPPVVCDSEETLQLAQEIRLKMKQLNKEIKPINYAKINKLFEIINDEIVPIVNEVDARIQNFENHFMKEAAKFVRDFKSLAKEVDESLDKITVLDKENECLLRAVVSQDIMSIVQSPSVVKTSQLQTELERTKGRFENLKGISVNTKFAKPSILGKLPSTSGSKLYSVTPFPTTGFIPKVVEKHDLTNPVTSHSVPKSQE
ncbi:hypothetical protein Tco_0924836 [Tanacetum coccineum]|uniref:Uncharacterized protein n=1 Tax=Tanacetum coccineum TaxID=301880 RepID=A0ABQ5D6I3_9ASTR